MIGTGLMEEQIFNSFVNNGPESTGAEIESLPQTEQPLELSVHILDIWSSDDERKGQVNLWENDEAKESRQVGEVEEKKEEKETVEGKVEEAKSSGEKA